ncbi:dUTP diphosphatase [Bacillus kwashiorkori]|uniref:dUTP diphosphatase n=1 Tax=Bacillus kwashiorkori TaxID=1522318 RepID=UPI00078273BD|nr:dUTP diphosphatase [Bacillus kwashiorkori]
MNLQEMFQLQRILDERIETEHELLNEDLFDKKVLALLVEVGELANETRCFKFWSEKAASPKEVILEEFVDGLHFILSLGIVLKFHDYVNDIPLAGEIGEMDATAKFIEVFAQIQALQQKKSEAAYWKLYQSYYELGKILGFTPEEVEAAYLAKNQVNHKRQDEGY